MGTLERWGGATDDLHRNNFPKELIKNFQKACSPLSQISENEKVQLLSPLVDHLLVCLKDQRGEDGAPVRVGGHIPDSVVTSTTMEIIDVLGGRLDILPQLREILYLLLDVKTYRARESRQPDAQEAAILILALTPETGVNQVAKLVGVSPSTVSRWLSNDDNFKRQLKEIKESIFDPRWREMAEKALKYSLLSEEDLTE